MWLLAFSVWLGGKWMTWWDVGRWSNATLARKCAYFLAWPGMNAREFLDDSKRCPRPAAGEWVLAGVKTCFGLALVWGVIRTIPSAHDLVRGWAGSVGLVFVLHFGLFHLIALAWQNAGVNAAPIMRAPLKAASVSEFWNRRWNVAFNQLALRFVFHPLARAMNPAAACLATFVISGLIHDFLLSIPAGGGYGLPTAYFILQGVAVFSSDRCGWHSRFLTVLVTAAPVFWLFHPPFIRNVILPMLTAIGAT